MLLPGTNVLWSNEAGTAALTKKRKSVDSSRRTYAKMKSKLRAETNKGSELPPVRKLSLNSNSLSAPDLLRDAQAKAANALVVSDPKVKKWLSGTFRARVENSTEI